MVYLPKEYKNLFPEKKKHKYSAKSVVIDGHRFPSKKEGRRYQELKLQLHCGLISGLELQPKFVLQDSFKYKNKTIRAISYYADFRYINSEGVSTIEDVKSKITAQNAVYRIKKKMLLKHYPNINFIET